MIDYEGITARLEKLQEYAGYLKDYQKIPLKKLKQDHTLQGAVFHYLQLAIECVTQRGYWVTGVLGFGYWDIWRLGMFPFLLFLIPDFLITKS